MEGDTEMPDEENSGAIPNPADLWKQWYDTTVKMWSNTTMGDTWNAADLFGLYNQWLKVVEDARQRTRFDPMGAMDSAAVYRQWLEAMCDISQQAVEAGSDPTGYTAQWIEIMEDLRARMTAGDGLPTDPLTMFRQWYNATSEVSSKIAADVIGSEAFLESVSRFLETYAGFYKTFSRASEQYYRSLQLPTRSDITRVAGLVVALESKVDRIEEAFEDFEYGYSNPATAEAVSGLSERLHQVEKKLDRLLQAVEQREACGGPEGVRPDS